MKPETSVSTTRKKCGSEDSIQHLITCVGLEMSPPSINPEAMAEFHVELANGAYQVNAGLPEPRRIVGELSNGEWGCRFVITHQSRDEVEYQPDEISFTVDCSELGIDWGGEN